MQNLKKKKKKIFYSRPWQLHFEKSLNDDYGLSYLKFLISEIYFDTNFQWPTFSGCSIISFPVAECHYFETFGDI